MTKRKPLGMSFESFIDRQIREAQERGDFDDLPGKGKPMPDDGRPLDEHWWAKQLIAREGLDLLPDTLALKRRREKVLENVMTLRSERAVRRELEALNAAIRKANSGPTTGPPSTVVMVDIDAVVKRWKRQG